MVWVSIVELDVDAVDGPGRRGQEIRTVDFHFIYKVNVCSRELVNLLGNKKSEEGEDSHFGRSSCHRITRSGKRHKDGSTEETRTLFSHRGGLVVKTSILIREKVRRKVSCLVPLCNR